MNTVRLFYCAALPFQYPAASMHLRISRLFLQPFQYSGFDAVQPSSMLCMQAAAEAYTL